MSGALPEGLLEIVRERLAAGKPLRRTLPGGGRLHIDRPLPFLTVYRQPSDRDDPGTERLVLGQASYLRLAADESLAAPVRDLVEAVVATLAESFGAFLLLELWTAYTPEGTEPEPLLRVVTPDQQAPLAAVKVLAGALDELALASWRPQVRHVEAKTAAPRGLPPLLEPAVSNRLNCYMVGLELEPIFRDRAGLIYPELIRQLGTQLAAALQRGFFAFARDKTSAEPEAYQGLGRRAMVRAVRRVDDALGELCGRFDFLLDVTPVDTADAWRKFEDSGFAEPPSFRYRPLTTDADLLLRELYAVPLEEVEDPTLDRIFREKLREVARQLTMLADRNTHRFLQGSLQLYGDVEPELLRLAEGLLAAIEAPEEPTAERSVDAEEFARLAAVELARYRESYEALDAGVEIRADVSGLMVSQGRLLVDRSLSLTAERARALLQHEVGTHVLSHVNGSSQPLKVLATGLAGYEALQEGLAVLAECLVGGLTAGRLRLLAARVVAVDRMVRGAGFVEIFRELAGERGLVARTAFTLTMRVVRGGGLTKDALYLRGLQQVAGYLREGGDLDLLFLGKFGLPHVSVVRELLYRGVLHPAPLRPAWLESPGAAERLARVRDGATVLEMLERNPE